MKLESEHETAGVPPKGVGKSAALRPRGGGRPPRACATAPAMHLYRRDTGDVQS